MSEAAPLTSAHYHARKGAAEEKQAHFTQAVQENQLASTDFSRAAKGTSDAEALRVLKLLEEQHRRLADILKTRDIPQYENTSGETTSTEPLVNSKDVSAPLDKVGISTAKPATASLASARVGSTVRESSPSLARDIASRRGIPQPSRTQLSAAAQARARQLSPESRRRASSGTTPKMPPSIMESQSNLQQPKKAKQAEDDEGFAKFYSNLTSGTMSRLSSVLAYAGLPLTVEDTQPDRDNKQKSEKRTVSAGNNLDVKKIFSKAALDAIEDEHRQRGSLGGFGPGESFYVVQKGGGTFSYADIAKAQQQVLQGIGEEDEGEFVDATEAPGPPSPKRSRFSNQHRGSFGSPRTEEELELENTTLKHTLEQLAGRLTAFETHAQDASMQALTQSMVGLRPTPASGQASMPTPVSSNAVVDAATQERLRQLERQIEQQAEHRQKLEDHALKLEKLNRKWKARFDDLAKGARAKRERAETKVEDGAGDGVVGES